MSPADSMCWSPVKTGHQRRGWASLGGYTRKYFPAVTYGGQQVLTSPKAPRERTTGGSTFGPPDSPLYVSALGGI